MKKEKKFKGGISINEELQYGEILVLGCGNLLKGDDGFGNMVASKLIEGKMLPKMVNVIDAGTSGPYFVNLLNNISKYPKELIIVDSGDFDGNVGELKFFNADDIEIHQGDYGIHTWPLSNELVKYRGNVHILLCKVDLQEDCEFSVGLSPAIERSIDTACSMINEHLEVMM